MKSSRERLAEYNRLMSRKKKFERIHTIVIDSLIGMSFLVVLYIAFGGH